MCVHSTTRKINSIIAPGGHHEQYWLSSDTGPPLSTGNKRILSSHTGTCNVHNFYETVTLNPFTLRAAKRGLTILEIFYLQSHFLENI